MATGLKMVSLMMLLALAANQPAFAKEAHAQHGARAVAGAAKAAGARGGSAKGTEAKGANPARAKSDGAIGPEAIVAPPVLPPKSTTQQRNPGLSPSVKIVPMASVLRGHSAATTQAPRNAIGQPVAAPKNFNATHAHVSPALQAPGVIHAPPPAASPKLMGGNSVTANAALSNRASINGAAVSRPSSTSAIGGPARPNYGLNGTTLQNKH
jgi:hypothetical protein